MSKVKIETITAVHVGSGETLQYGTDFVSGIIDGNDVISIIEPRKVLDLIGVNNLSQWVASIERKDDTSQVVKRYAPEAKLEDYSKRAILEWSIPKSTDTLKEQIHDGQGRPYIPGSSIKGAIRTAVLASIVDGVSGRERKIDKTKRDQQGNPIPGKNGRVQYKVDAKGIESELFGGDPNKDVFRFLQVGDAYFGDMFEVAIRMVNVNERERSGYWDTSKPQLIEAISPEDSTEFQLKLNIKGYEFAQEKVAFLPDCMTSLPKLFNTINIHTHNLLQEEIEYWKAREEDDDSETVSAYLEKVEDIMSVVNDCQEGKECVLRLGHGSGWRFITGAWAEQLENFESLVVPVSRPKNHNYEQYDFPKTRRVDEECELLGFVKLTAME